MNCFRPKLANFCENYSDCVYIMTTRKYPLRRQSWLDMKGNNVRCFVFRMGITGFIYCKDKKNISTGYGDQLLFDAMLEFETKSNYFDENLT